MLGFETVKRSSRSWNYESGESLKGEILYMINHILSKFPKEDNSKMDKEALNVADAIFTLVTLVTLISMIVLFGLLRDWKLSLEELPEVKAEPIPVVQKTYIVAQAEKYEPGFTDEEIIAMVVHAEAQGEPMVGKVAVACVVYNRADYYGLTIESVVNAKNQFAISDDYTEEDLRAVEIARDNRDLFPENLLYFRADHYHTFGSDWLPIGNHYFSLEKEKT